MVSGLCPQGEGEESGHWPGWQPWGLAPCCVAFPEALRPSPVIDVDTAGPALLAHTAYSCPTRGFSVSFN